MLHYKSSGDVGDTRRVSLPLGDGSMGNATVSGQNTANGQRDLSNEQEAELSGGSNSSAARTGDNQDGPKVSRQRLKWSRQVSHKGGRGQQADNPEYVLLPM